MNLVEMVEHLKAQAGDTFPDEDDGEDEVEELGAELVDGEAIAGDYDANYSGLEFIEQSGERVMLDPSVND